MKEDRIFQGDDWTVQTDPATADVEALRERLRAFNGSRADMAGGQELAVFLRNGGGDLAAGISGWLWGEVLEIDYLWVDEPLRGKGVGGRLLRTLEDEARERGGRQAILDTFDFQASDFYQAQGYEVLGVIEGYGVGHQKYFLRKSLIEGK